MEYENCCTGHALIPTTTTTITTDTDVCCSYSVNKSELCNICSTIIIILALAYTSGITVICAVKYANLKVPERTRRRRRHLVISATMSYLKKTPQQYDAIKSHPETISVHAMRSSWSSHQNDLFLLISPWLIKNK